MDLTFSQRNFSVMTGFYLVLPGGDTHNVSIHVGVYVFPFKTV